MVMMKADRACRLEIRELLSKYEYDGDNIAIVRGSALKALESDDVNSPERSEYFI
jgi:elongation factor Tu